MAMDKTWAGQPAPTGGTLGKRAPEPMQVTASQTGRESYVRQAGQRLEIAIGTLRHCADLLEDRLTLVMRPAGPSDTAKQEEGTGVIIADALNAQARDAEVIAERLKSILDRLEL